MNTLVQGTSSGHFPDGLDSEHLPRRIGLRDRWANQCGRCSRWQKSHLTELTRYQFVHLCKACFYGRGPAVEAPSSRKETKAQKQWRRDQVDLDLAALHDLRLTAARAKRKEADNRTVLTAALEALGIPGYLQVRSLRPGAEGRIINFVNPVEEAA